MDEASSSRRRLPTGVHIVALLMFLVGGIWLLAAIVLPFLGVLVYLGTQGEQMAERSAKRAQAAHAQADDYVRSVAGSTEGPAAEIEKAKQLLDSGAINQAEFDAIKAKAVR